jgi:uncharacterized membrane protein
MKPLTDKQLDSTIANMLRWGVTLAAAVVFLGGILSLRNPTAAAPDYAHFHPTPLPSLSEILRSAAHLDPSSIIQLGILLLIATPVLRVVFCIAGFSRQRDKVYVFISSAVLLILIYSLFRGGR